MALIILTASLVPSVAATFSEPVRYASAATEPTTVSAASNSTTSTSISTEASTDLTDSSLQAPDLDLETDSAVSRSGSEVTAKTTKAKTSVKMTATKQQYKWMTFTATFYAKDEPGTNGSDMTATGKRAKQGRTIAVDPRVIPYGTKVYIEGWGYRIAEDCGGAIKGNKIDIYMNSYHDFPKAGRIKVRLRIVG